MAEQNLTLDDIARLVKRINWKAHHEDDLLRNPISFYYGRIKNIGIHISPKSIRIIDYSHSLNPFKSPNYDPILVFSDEGVVEIYNTVEQRYATNKEEKERIKPIREKTIKAIREILDL